MYQRHRMVGQWQNHGGEKEEYGEARHHEHHLLSGESGVFRKDLILGRVRQAVNEQTGN